MAFTLPNQLSFFSPRVRTIIVVALLIGGLILTLILVKKDTDNRSKAATSNTICQTTSIDGYEMDDPPTTNETALLEEMSRASAALRKSADDYLASPSSDLLKEQVNQASTLRKEALVTLMRENPQKAINIIKEDQTNTSLRTLANSDPECMEQQKTIEGELAIYIQESFSEDGNKIGPDEIAYSITTSDSEIQLYLTAPTLSGIQSGSKLKVKGYQVNDNIISDTTQNGAIEVLSQPPLPTQFDQSSLLPQIIQKTYAQSSSSKNNLGVLFLLLNFSDTKRSNLSKSYLENNVVPKIKSYYNEVSYGKTKINATILEVQLSQPTFCKWMQAFRLPESPEVDKKVNFKKYDNIMIFAPFRKEGGKMCGGAAGMLGKFTLKTDEGDIPIGVMATTDSYNSSPSSISQTIAATTIHEMGHGFGMNHAAKITCPGVIKAGPSCAIEYGDDWDRMGGGKEYPGHLSAARKDKLGWWHSSTNIKTVTSDGTYTLEPYEIQSSGLKVVKIPRSDGKFVYVEFRQPIGVDAAFPRGSGVFNGVLLHANYGITYPTGGNSDVSLINPPVSNNNVLPPGGSYTDPDTKTTIKLTNIRYGSNLADARAIVEVALGASVKPTATPTKIPPTPTKAPSPTSSSNPTLSLFLTPAYITASTNSPQRIQLSWTTANVTSCVASGGWTGAKATSGNEWTTPLTKTTTYTLTCTGPGGSISKTGTVTVEPTKPPTATPTPTKQPTPTPSQVSVVNGTDLIIESAVLTDSASVAKKTFKVNEPIYIRFVIKNQGAQVAKNKYETNGSIWTQVYGNRPLPVAINTGTDINIWVRNQNNIKSLQRITYASSASRDANYSAFGAGKSFKQATPGTYTARIFVNYDHLAKESNYNNNQAIIPYTVTK